MAIQTPTTDESSGGIEADYEDAVDIPEDSVLDTESSDGGTMFYDEAEEKGSDDAMEDVTKEQETAKKDIPSQVRPIDIDKSSLTRRNLVRLQLANHLMLSQPWLFKCQPSPQRKLQRCADINNKAPVITLKQPLVETCSRYFTCSSAKHPLRGHNWHARWRKTESARIN